MAKLDLMEFPEAVTTGPLPGLDLVRATEAAAIATARLAGRGEQDRVKSVAAAAMLQALEELGISGRVVLGPRGDGLLASGSSIGDADGSTIDLGVYPVEGASLVARGLPNAISMIVTCERDTFPSLPAVAYMEKLVVGPEARGAIDLDNSVADNLRRIAFAQDRRVGDLTVAILDRPRHQGVLDEVRSAGARVLALEDGDVNAGLLAAADWSNVDAMIGFGGLQEAILVACAVRDLGGDMACRLWPRSDEERVLAGDDANRVYGLDQLVPPHVTVTVTGITGGPLLEGVHYGGTWIETSSLVFGAPGRTVRRIRTRHRQQRSDRTV